MDDEPSFELDAERIVSTHAEVKRMPPILRCEKGLKLLVLSGLVLMTQCALGQTIATLLQLQRSNAELQIEDIRQGLGRNINEIATKNDPQDVWKYPNTESCLVVYEDGKYAFEKREERTVGRPRVKSAEGMLSPADLQELKAILENEELKKITTPQTPELPADTQAIREIERWDAHINHAGTVQQFTTVKERVKTGATSSGASGPYTGMDIYLDNGAPYKKTLSPLMKWFEEMGKKSKSGMKEAKPQYCSTMNSR